MTAGQKRESPVSVCRCGRNGIRPRSIRGPSSSSTAGSTVTEPATAQATTMIVAAREAVEDVGADQEHARHRDRDRRARDEHGAAGRARGALERLVRGRPRWRSSRERIT